MEDNKRIFPLTVTPERSINGYSAHFKIGFSDAQGNNISDWGLANFVFAEVKGDKWNIWRLFRGVNLDAQTREEAERVIEEVKARLTEFRDQYAKQEELKAKERKFQKGESETF